MLRIKLRLTQKSQGSYSKALLAKLANILRPSVISELLCSCLGIYKYIKSPIEIMAWRGFKTIYFQCISLRTAVLLSYTGVVKICPKRRYMYSRTDNRDSIPGFKSSSPHILTTLVQVVYWRNVVTIFSDFPHHWKQNNYWHCMWKSYVVSGLVLLLLVLTEMWMISYAPRNGTAFPGHCSAWKLRTFLTQALQWVVPY